MFGFSNQGIASVASLLLINARRHMFTNEVYRKLMRRMRTDAIVN
ncbi:hypothetical protein N9S22_01525 [Paracoccaceae bacterium]|nr:hypothetical protein [Paracoccaceae bacterium]